MAGVAFGQTITGKINKDPYYFAAVCSAVGTTLVDGSKLICKAGGVAWFVAPNSTEISGTWANGQYNSTAVGDKCCVSEWGDLSSLLSANVCGYVATQWFVPSSGLLGNPLIQCRGFWSYSTSFYFSSTETNATCAVCAFITAGSPSSFPCGNKSGSLYVRALRCVTY